MLGTEDPILAALAEDENKLDWQERTDLWSRRRAVGVAIRRFFAAIAEHLFIWTRL